MKTNKIKYLYSGVLSIFLLSCDSELDQNPTITVSPETVFTTEEGANFAVNGMYSRMQDPDAFNGTWIGISEFQSDNGAFKGSFTTLNQIYNYLTVATNTTISSMYRDTYTINSSANTIINRTPDITDEGFTDDERNEIMGHARFCKAFSYLNLVNAFGQPYSLNSGNNEGIVLVNTDPTVSLELGENERTRSSVAEVYNEIISLLKLAESNLPDSSDNTKASKGAAQALLARVYMELGDYQNAAGYADKVINNGNYILANDYSFYNTTDNEFIFTLVSLPDDAPDNSLPLGSLFNPTEVGGRGDIAFSDDLIALFDMEPTDLRYTELTQIGTDASGNSDILFTKKYPNASTSEDNAPLIRVSEMYLIRAEANMRGGLSIGDTPLNDVNKIRTRAGLADLTSITVHDIMNEKRKEFCFEGLRRMDLLKNGENLRPMEDSQFNQAQFGENKTILPIPQAEVDSYGFSQNSGY